MDHHLVKIYLNISSVDDETHKLHLILILQVKKKKKKERRRRKQELYLRGYGSIAGDYASFACFTIVL
jgi:hypothetical protein